MCDRQQEAAGAEPAARIDDQVPRPSGDSVDQQPFDLADVVVALVAHVQTVEIQHARIELVGVDVAQREEAWSLIGPPL